MLDMTCPECGSVVRATGSQLSRLPGEEWHTHVDYSCVDPECSGRLRVTLPRQARRGSIAEADPVAD